MQQLSFAQQGLWLVDQLTPDNTAYTIQYDYEIVGALDVWAFCRAVDLLVRRHEPLRSYVAVDGGVAHAATREDATGYVDVVDLRGRRDARTRGLRLLDEYAATPFDLASGPLFRIRLVRTADDHWFLHINVHHIVFDGESTRILERELSSAYAHFARSQTPSLPPLPTSYGAYAAAQNTWLQGADAQRSLAYWRRQLSGVQNAELPTSRPRPDLPSFRGAEVVFTVPDETSRHLEQVARQARTTLFVTTLAAYAYLLSRYTGAMDVVVGVPFSGRTTAEVQDLIGLFVNTLALRADMRGDPTFRDLVDRLRPVTLDAAEHQGIPFERVVTGLQPERAPGRNPLFQNWFDIVELDAVGQGRPGLDLPGVRCVRLERPETTTRFETECHLIRERGGLRGRLTYATDVFDGTAITELAGSYVTLLNAALAHPGGRLSALPVLGPVRIREVLAAGRAPGPTGPDDTTIGELFESRVRSTPDAVAVDDGAEALTYRELCVRADRLAARLRVAGAGPEQVVGVCVERSVNLAVALLAVVRSGAAYLPMDPELPAGRLDFMVEDGHVAHVVTTTRALSAVPACVTHVVCADVFTELEPGAGTDNSTGRAGPDNLFYVIYTSGSTGEPKGAAVTHRSFSNLIHWHASTYSMVPGHDVISAVANVSFDATGWEIWPALIGGARLRIVPSDVVRDPRALLNHLAEAGTTGAFLPTPLAEALIRERLGALTSLRYVLTGGDTFRPRTEDDPRVVVFNHYGPTETTVVATATGPLAAPWPDLSIGRPIAGVTAYVLDRHLQLVPFGVSGELYVGGAGVARGYVGRPRLTAERFLPDPFAARSGARMYRTGDLVRWQTDGTLAFLGRADRQLKIRGLRIEPAEVEAALMSLSGIRDAAVVAAGEGEARRLVAYVTNDGPMPSASELRDQLSSKLPGYMVPAAVVPIASMPLTSSGKVNRRELPDPPMLRPMSRAPDGPVEQVIAESFAEMLGVPDVGGDDDFFTLGGHSLAAARIAARLTDAFGVELPLRAVFEHRTVRDLGAEVARRVREEVAAMAGDDIAAALADLRSSDVTTQAATWRTDKGGW